ncbi:YaeQ family protein [soil metagenome]
MALKATVHKAEVAISDMDRGYYHTHLLTLAQHPSETLERLMLRLVVFVLHASEQLLFTRGLSADDEPELWQKNYTGDIELWIELGEPDERRLRQACGRADQVWLYSYGRGSNVWWQGIQNKITRLKNLRILHIAPATLSELAKLHNRSMQLQATVEDNQLWLSNGDQCVLVETTNLYP